MYQEFAAYKMTMFLSRLWQPHDGWTTVRLAPFTSDTKFPVFILSLLSSTYLNIVLRYDVF